MRLNLWSFLLLILAQNMNAQNFVTELFFEDNEGRKDTLTFGRSEEAPYQFGEANSIEEIALESFDVRFFLLNGTNTNTTFEILWNCDHEDGDVSPFGSSPEITKYLYESKEVILPLKECEEGGYGYRHPFLIPVEAAFPITIRWDQSLFQDSCNQNANISESVFSWQDHFLEFGTIICEERINYFHISLNNMDSFILETPNAFTFLRPDSTLVAAYYLTVPHSIDGNILINNSETIKEEVKIFPIPVTDLLQIDFEENFDYEIVNIQGKSLLKGNTNHVIDVNDLSSGIYFLQLSQENKIYQSKRFIKL